MANEKSWDEEAVQAPDEKDGSPPVDSAGEDAANTAQEDAGTNGAAITEDSASADASSRPPKNWYIIHAYSGFEPKVAESLRSRAEAFGFADRLGQILIPTEEVMELRNGKEGDE